MGPELPGPSAAAGASSMCSLCTEHMQLRPTMVSHWCLPASQHGEPTQARMLQVVQRPSLPAQLSMASAIGHDNTVLFGHCHSTYPQAEAGLYAADGEDLVPPLPPQLSRLASANGHNDTVLTVRRRTVSTPADPAAQAEDAAAVDDANLEASVLDALTGTALTCAPAQSRHVLDSYTSSEDLPAAAVDDVNLEASMLDALTGSDLTCALACLLVAVPWLHADPVR